MQPIYELQTKGREERLSGYCECEWEFSGVKGGCMDHLAIVYGRPGCVVSLDCRDEKVCSVDGLRTLTYPRMLRSYS